MSSAADLLGEHVANQCVSEEALEGMSAFLAKRTPKWALVMRFLLALSLLLAAPVLARGAERCQASSRPARRLGHGLADGGAGR